MKLKIQVMAVSTGKPVAFIHEVTAKKLGVHTGELVHIEKEHHIAIAVVDLARQFVKKGNIGISRELAELIGHDGKGNAEVNIQGVSEGSKILHEKLNCRTYTQHELNEIMQDIVSNKLSEAEIAYFVSGVHHCGMSEKETMFLTNAIVSTGTKIKWPYKIVADKHSIGGIPANRTTPIVVAICAVAGVIMPKTSSRAITSAAGTADTIEAMARVNLSISELKSIVKKTGACLAWGGSLGLAPADDKLIRVEKLLMLDPESQLIASILAKKLAVGSTHVLIDIPYGDGAKVSHKEGEHLKHKFESIGRELGLYIHVVLTKGTEPIGNGVGPTLELKDILKVLKRDNGPIDLEDKSLFLSGEILEMVKKSKRGQGIVLAKKILDSKQAYDKFCEIIIAQGGDPKSWLPEAAFHHTIRAKKSGIVKNMHNGDINYAARLAGSPLDKSAGLYLFKHVGDKIKKEDKLLTIYAESEVNLLQAVDFVKKKKLYDIV